MRTKYPAQLVQYFDALINTEVLKRAQFPIKVSPIDCTCYEVDKRHTVELQNLYKEVSEEILNKYLGDKTNEVSSI